ncbi:hypothetical protein FRY74_06425 [Vicingus serpentipes]|uniref:Uncharacterized protein n=1 Tax=Vicingus serpentipes TaxID=1926625 RepID=A0A5C6RW80_9FLAO|nr:hypothetical protein [Vicingus serpentipes]TXB66205.1 hypothetical protein FRY74_06425 [Vicingus serpentipes]
MTLYDKYGHCIIPAGTKLYKGGEQNDYDACIFFGLQKYVAAAFQNNSGKIQIWSVKRDIKLLFMVLDLNKSSWAKSSVAEIYREYFPSDNELNELDIKHFDHQKRDKLIEKLKEENIIGWVSSLEDKVDLEVCLFPDGQELNRLIELEKVIDKDNDEYEYLNALDTIDIYPSGRFFSQTKDKLTDSPYKDYEKMVASWTEDEIKQGLTAEQAGHYHLNLRTKLKI